MIQRKNHINLCDIPPKVINDRKVCLNCDKPLPKRRQKYCSDNCFHEWFAKHDQSAMRTRLFVKRERCCQKCNKSLTSSDGYVLDHITPIALGGAEFEEDNLQILCAKCNKIKTKDDIKRIAEQRRINKVNIKGQRRVGDFLSPTGESLIKI